MTLRITKIEDAGDLDRERLVLRASDDVDIGDFIVLIARATGEEKVRSGDIARAYWFEDKRIKKGDLVVLYSKSGTRREKENASGTTSHFYYWGRETACWNERVRVVLAHAPSWQILVSPKDVA